MTSKKRRPPSHLLFLILLFLFSPTAFSQTGNITGLVKGEEGSPMAGVTVRNKATGEVVQTESDGRFSIRSATPRSTLVISFVGYFPDEQEAAVGEDLEVILRLDATAIEETVVVGYQTVSRKKNTGAVSTISGKELENVPAASFDMILQGRLPGVNVQNLSGSPGGMGTVYVRGSTGLSNTFDEAQILSSPLYVVDGVPQPTEQYANLNTGTGTNFLAGINPNDIESVSVLRDASAAAIYGSRGSNGVVLITTKKGVSREPTVMINGYSGLTLRPELRDVVLGSAEREQKMSVLREQLTHAEAMNMPRILTDSLNPAFNGNTNYQDLFYQRGLINNADVSINGGGNAANYRFSANYYDEEGIVKATGFSRLSTRLNLMSKAVKEKLTINPIVAYTNMRRARGSGDGVNPFPLSAGDMPTSLFNLSDSRRDYYTGAFDENLDQNVTNQLSFNLNITAELLPQLTFNSQSSFQYNTGRRDFNSPSILNSNLGNSSSSWTSAQENWLLSNYLNYSDTYGKHTLTALLGQDIQHDKYQVTQANGYYGASDHIQVVQGFRQDYIGAFSDYQAWGLLSYYSRLSYDYDSRYVLSASIRTDGSSRFGSNNKFGWFPAAAVAWLLSEESFLKDHHSISLMKLRASYGTTGNLPTQNYLAYNTYRVNAGGYGDNSSIPSYNGVVAITPNFVNGVAQDDLTWEKGMSWNIGADLELFNGKYTLSADIYNRETRNQLFSVQLPVNTGYDYAMTNSVGVRNAGVEVVLSASPLAPSNPISWRSNFNMSYNRNQIMSLPNGGRDLVMSGDRFDASHILSIGSPINAFYLYETLGVYSTINDVPVNPYSGELFGNGGAYGPGMFHLKDQDGDFFIDSYRDGINPDKLPIGDPNPRWTGGWHNQFSYKNFSLSFFMNFTLGRDVLNLFEPDQFGGSAAADLNTFAARAYPDLSKYDIWRQEGDVADYAKIDIGTYRYYYTSAQTFFLENGSYVRLKNVIGSYDFDQRLVSRLGINRLRVYGVVDNLLTWKASRRLPDAEVVNQYGEYTGNGYPIPRKFTLGLEITL